MGAVQKEKPSPWVCFCTELSPEVLWRHHMQSWLRELSVLVREMKKPWEMKKP